MNDLLIKKIEWYCGLDSVQLALNIESPIHVRFLAQGEYNINYLVEAGESKFVFRLNTASQLELENQIAYEYGALEKLAPSGVTPLPLYLDDTKEHFDYGLLCMTYLEGGPLEYHRDLHHAARLFATIHNMTIEPFKGVLIEENHLCHARVVEGNRWLEDYRGCEKKNHKTLKILEQLLHYCSENAEKDDAYFEMNQWTVVNNTEVNSHNFIIGEQGQYIIDWEKPVLSDPVQDITQFLAPTTTLWRSDYLFSEAEIDAFYEGYKKHSLRDSTDLRGRVERYKPYLTLRALSWCAHAWVGYQGERMIQNAETYEKIKRYLEPSFMEKLLVHYL